MPINLRFIGVDVAQKTLMVAEHGAASTVEIANATRAITTWLRGLEGRCAIGMESTGSCHRLLAGLAHAAGHVVYVLNPRDIRHYGRALGRRAKTDRVDALLIARYLSQEHDGLHPWEMPSRTQELLSSALNRRRVLVTTREQIRASFAGHEAELVELAPTLAQIGKLIADLDVQMQEIVKADEALAALKARLQSVAGIGEIVSTALANLLLRYRFRNSDALIAYIGLDPRASDSGQHRGRRHLSKRGPAELRRLIFNAAMSGAHTPAWVAYYEQLRNRGLKGTEAFIALARKMLRTVFSMTRYGTNFDPQRLRGACAKP